MCNYALRDASEDLSSSFLTKKDNKKQANTYGGIGHYKLLEPLGAKVQPSLYDDKEKIKYSMLYIHSVLVPVIFFLNTTFHVREWKGIGNVVVKKIIFVVVTIISIIIIIISVVLGIVFTTIMLQSYSFVYMNLPSVKWTSLPASSYVIVSQTQTDGIGNANVLPVSKQSKHILILLLVYTSF